MPRLRWSAAALFASTLFAAAQTYTPKTIRVQGTGQLDPAEIRRLIDLRDGTPVTREQIEAAMQRLADSGLFANLRYTVDASTLTFLLEPASGSQAEPVRYSNFVWWQPGELEPLVEARVPLFRGKLPLTGQLTSQVEAALVALLAEKGIAGAKVEAMQSTLDGPGVALTVTQPTVTLGDVHLTGVAPEVTDQTNLVTSRLAGRDFDTADTPHAITSNTVDSHRNLGYLDATVDPPTFSPPRKELHGYVVDANATVHPGTQYHIGSIQYLGADPKLEPEVAKATEIKVGDPAGEMNVSIASGLARRVLSLHGYQEARTTARVARDAATHTVAYTFTLVPGPVYTFAGVDASGLSADAQTRFAGAFHANPGALADSAVLQQIAQAMQAAGVRRTAGLQLKLDRTAHTATYIIASRAATGIPVDGAEAAQP